MREQAAIVLAFGVRQSILTPVVQGVILGSVYGLVGLGLVLLYKSNRIFNFAQGEFGTVAALVAYNFATGDHSFPKLPYVAAVVLGLAAGVATAMLTERLVVRRLFQQPRVTIVVATVGVSLFLIGAELLTFGAIPTVFPPIRDGVAFTLFGRATDPLAAIVTFQQLAIIIAVVILAVAATIFFRTRYGLAILAVSQEPTAASVVGISVRNISTLTWAIAGLLGGVTGILVGGLKTTNFAPAFMTAQATQIGPLIPGFTAAVLGGITSLPGAFVGGLTIGVLEQLVATNVHFPGASSVLVAAMLLAVLLARPAGLLGKET